MESTPPAKVEIRNKPTGENMIAKDDVQAVVERVGVAVMLYYPEIHVDDADYDLMEQAGWCLEPISDELSEDAGTALRELVARTMIDPSKNREEMFSVLMELQPAE